jgi:hypothetical protein
MKVQMLTSYKAGLPGFLERAALCALALMAMPITATAFDSRCSVRIEVVFAQSAGNPRNPQLTSLTANPAYSLSWIEGKGGRQTYDLTGPGADTRCRDGVDLLRRDPEIFEVRVVETTRF